MTTQIMATVIDGMFKPDQPLPLAEQTRVKLTVEAIAQPAESMSGWEAYRAWICQHSVRGLGRRLMRDELHERR